MSDALTPEARKQAEFGELFDSPLGRRVLQQILDHAGVYEALGELSSDEILTRHGARGLALDIAILAGLLPEVPGSGGRAVPDQPAQALTGNEPPEGDGSIYAEI